MAQRYLPEIRQGDKRIIVLDGEPLGAVLRVPREDETRGNIHVGGATVKAPLSARDREICARLAPRLRADGLWFVGLDVIGDWLTEINVTSPTGIQEINALDGVTLEARSSTSSSSGSRRCAPERRATKDERQKTKDLPRRSSFVFCLSSFVFSSRRSSARSTPPRRRRGPRGGRAPGSARCR